MNKIVSNFYLIKVGGKPSYVGYTNRPIKARFKEHLRDKDFGDELVALESLGSLKYSFTWNGELISQYAREVSDRETELILEYGTQDSVWQKGASGNLGGQTWSDIKHFIRTNRDSPKFRGLSGESILAYLERSAEVYGYMRSFVNHINLPVSTYLSNFVNTLNLPEVSYLIGFVSSMNLPEVKYMKGFVSGMNLPEVRYLSDFVNGMKLPETVYIKSFVGTMNLPEVRYLSDFVKHMNKEEVVYVMNFVNNMNLPVVTYMSNFVGHMKKPIDN